VPGAVDRPPDGLEAAGLLARVAEALTACDRAGLKVRLHHDAVETRIGYVLRIRKQWVPRTKTYDPLVPPDDGSDED
jgi:hypothetical protein